MSDPCQPLPWDSEFFGFPIARATADTLTPQSAADIDRWCAAHAVRCLYFLARFDDPPTVRLAEAHGYRLVDGRLTLDRSIDAAGATTLRDWREDDLPALQAIARIAHQDTRFFFDDRFDRGRCCDLYARWVEASCHGWAQGVLVSGPPGEPEGYITCHLDPNHAGRIGLIAVGEGARGRGVGKALVRGALAWFAARGMRRVSVVTQSRNIVSQRLYQRCGFATCELKLYYHKWYER